MGNAPNSPKLNETKKNNVVEGDLDDTSWLEAVDKSLVFVWCDKTIGTTSFAKDADNTLKNIAAIANRNRQLVHTFNEIDACREFIIHVNNVCLIVSGALGMELVPQIHNLQQVHSIYVFCVNKSKHKLWADHYRKVRNVCTGIGAICESLKSYVMSQAATDYDRIEFDVCNHEMNLSAVEETDICFAYSNLAKDLLLSMTGNGTDQADMVSYCRSEYTSESQIQMINDLECNYSLFDPVWWYTKNYFFQGIINRALRTRDLYTASAMQRFIKDLEMTLSKLYKNEPVSDAPLNLYFGQMLTADEFGRLRSNQGQLMCINQFVSANPEEGVALMHIKQQNPSAGKSTKISVLFKIHIDQTVEANVPYASIGAISQFVHEREYLLSMFSIFRIEEIRPLLNMPSIWLVSLQLMGKDDLPLMPLRPCTRQEPAEESTIEDVGDIVKDRLSRFKSTHKLFKCALNYNRQELRAIMLHYNMAIIYDALGDYEKSLEEYRGVLMTARSYIPTCQQNDDLCLTPVYANMGLTFQHNNRFNHAVDHAYRALQIASKAQTNSASEKELESACYFTLGTIHARDGKTSDARDFYERALRIRQEYLPLGHPDITVLQRLITILSSKSSDSD